MIDSRKMEKLIHRSVGRPGPVELRREGNVFFVGGDLPPRESLETIFESHCQAAAQLMVVACGASDIPSRSEELIRLLKKNFNVHIMARMDRVPSRPLLERIYAAGADLVEIPSSAPEAGRLELREAYRAAAAVFGPWGAAATLELGGTEAGSVERGIDMLLAAGIVPLVELGPGAEQSGREELEAVFRHLADGWENYRVALKPYLPLIAETAPLAATETPGRIRGFVERLRDRRDMAASDLRRHLRVTAATDSLDSAGL